MSVNGEETDEPTKARARRRGAPWLFGGLVLLLLSVLLVLQLFGLWEIFTPDRASDTLLIYALSTLNFVAFFLFSFIFIRSLLKLRRERRERQLGSKIKTRLVVYFIAVSLLPITAMALFSFMFFNRSLEKWFGSFPQDVVSQAKLAQEENDQTRKRSLYVLANTLAVAIVNRDEPRDEPPSDVLLSALAAHGELAFIAIVNGEDGTQQRIIYNDRDPLEKAQLDTIIRRSNESGSEVFNAEVAGVSYEVAQTPLPTWQLLVVVRERKAGDSLNNLIARAQSFEDFKGNQRKVRLLGLSTLGLLTLMLLFAATWSAIHLARGIGAPIRALAEASKEVAAGNLEHRVTAIADDELAVLASAFNDMTGQLAENRRRLEANASELREKNLALEERRHYIETILQTVSTGVVSLDEENRVTTINAAALSMLRLEQTPTPQTPLAEILSADDYAVLERVLWRARARGRATEQMELARGPVQEANGAGGFQAGGSVIPVALTATALTPRESQGQRGVVLVIEDLSELLAAQRAAAWSEVARRLAHEIKNPLTPIQLSAERIARNFPRPEASDESIAVRTQASRGNGNGHGAESESVARLVEECTTTISREVAGLKAMVDEFTRFARLPHARLEPSDLNEVVRQAVSLYEDRLEGVRMDVLLARELPGALLDPEQIRRVFVNLIDNSVESLAEVEGERRITIATGYDPARGLLIAEVADTGHGIARTDYARLFQPYFSTRGRGTGLGLAIVHRIMAEHGGRIRPETNRPRGARMIIEFPVAEDKQAEARP